MEKKYLIRRGCVFGILLLLLGAAQVVPAAIGKTVENEMSITFGINIQQRHDLDFVIKIPSVTFDITISENGDFATLELEGESYTITVGEAKLPAIRRLVEIPHGARPRVNVKMVAWKKLSLEDMHLPNQIVPVQPPVSKISETQDLGELCIDNDFYAKDVFLPQDIARVIDVGEIRGRRFALIEISPVQYNPSSGELKLMTSCEISIDLPGSDMIQTAENIIRYTTPPFEEVFKASFVNYGWYDNDIGDTGRDQEGYLIIVYDSFYNQILPFASWKQTLGFDVTVTNTSEVPGSGSLLYKIENYIEDAYYNWPIPPSYVLLVGDTSQVPTYTSGLESGVSCSDLYYVTISPGDYYPDIFIGRFPAASPSHVTAMVDKTLTYEQKNYPSPEFLTYAAFMAGNDNYQISEGTHNYCIEHYLEPNQWQYDRLYEVTYGATTQDVRNAFNDGRILGVFSGHGAVDYWADGPEFHQSDVNSLTNLGEYPFVFSHACVTGTFSYPECFGETWLRAADKAGIFFWGASASTFWDEDDWLQKNWFYAWWEDGIETIAGLTVQGMIYTVEDIGGPSVWPSRYYFEAYNILGDPSLVIEAIEFVWENDVGAVEINYPPENTVGGSITVNATIENFGINNQTDVPVSCEIFPGGEIIYFKDFEADNGGFTPGGTSLWQWGIPTSGPGSAHSGSKCWATNLYGDYPDYANAWLDSEPIVLPTGDATILSFWHWYDMESYYDGGNVKISTNGGVNWEILGSYLDPYPEDSASSLNEGIPEEPCFTGMSGGWKKVTFDLGDYASEEVIIRWHFGSDYSINYAGWFIDDVVIDTVFSDIPVYSASATVSVDTMTTEYVEFTPPWDAVAGTYAIKVKTELPGDQKPSNDQKSTVVTVFIPGDLDFDGDVDLDDLAQLLANYGTTSGATYEMGDIDGDGDVDLSDLAALLANYGTGT